eukprot:11842-Chlamydomonas_euryale.AAC.2
MINTFEDVQLMGEVLVVLHAQVAACCKNVLHPELVPHLGWAAKTDAALTCPKCILPQWNVQRPCLGVFTTPCAGKQVSTCKSDSGPRERHHHLMRA